MALERDVDPRSIRIYFRCDPAARYFGIGEKNIIKFNGPSSRAAFPFPGRPINSGEQGGYKSQDKQEPVFFHPLDFRCLALSPWKRARPGPPLHSSYELLGGRT
jgi:hypothetical protein